MRVETALVILLVLISVHQCYGGASNWTCTCFSSANKSDIRESNCSTSCHCKPDRDQQWVCLCPANGFPIISVTGSNSSCFTSCNCSSGPIKKQSLSRKLLLVTLIFCVVVTSVAFLASMFCYVYRRTRTNVSGQTPSSVSSDRESSWHSSANLIARKSSISQPNKTSFSSSLSGCFFQNASLFCVSKPETIHGMIFQFSYGELEQATDKFASSNVIGHGGSSCVYRGQLRDGKTAAIKRLNAPKGNDNDTLFSTEVELLSRLHHYHVVPLIGYCSEFHGKHAERLLVFEYMSYGNLRDCLDGEVGEKMTWNVRISLALGAARGLEYLHEAAAPRILHRDVKSTNILLDENWHAKITDLGMAKCLSSDGLQSGSSSPTMGLQGTFGYFAPEYAIAGCASPMSDVFSFGVVLLELITGRKPIQKPSVCNNKGEESLVIWAMPRLQDSKRVIEELPDPRLNGKFAEEEMQIMAYLAKECLLLEPEARPTMREVVQILSTIMPDTSRRRNFPINHLFPSNEKKKESKVGGWSRGGSRSAHEEESVDLTEPRFESFCLPNVKPVLLEPSAHI
ncbi:receptor-like serine/threonine-protein kinase NCRK isoform X3 [Raphanus sativus]|uniref:non-specific serine/threonine protein kinase n=1 Tax=Raphanus sativus TaxID=3726 RepID=A0A6J0JWS5_RAPSA|nr:receptor-like serine/threonine-protein kinase NCRK isoform X3 [Raphanus sativus]